MASMRLHVLRVVCAMSLGIRAAEPAQPQITDDNPLALPLPGAFQLRVLSSNLLELTRITTKASPTAKPREWDFVDATGQAHPPAATEFLVSAGGTKVGVQRVG